MRGFFLAGAAALVVLAAVVLLAHPGVDDRRLPPPAPANASAAALRTPPASAPPGAAVAAREPPEVAAAAPPTPLPGGLAARDARLARAAGLAPAGESTTARLLRTYSADELALLARFEALAGTPRAPALEELIALRRAGASAPALVEAATRLFTGDPLGRAAALEWIRTATPE